MGGRRLVRTSARERGGGSGWAFIVSRLDAFVSVWFRPLVALHLYVSRYVHSLGYSCSLCTFEGRMVRVREEEREEERREEKSRLSEGEFRVCLLSFESQEASGDP